MLTRNHPVAHKSEVQHAGSAKSSDIVLTLQPTECTGDPLVYLARNRNNLRLADEIN